MRARYRVLTTMFLSAGLAGCSEQIDVLYYPDKSDRETVRVISNVGTVSRCTREAVRLAEMSGDSDMSQSDYECGMGASNHPNFGRLYSRKVSPGWPDPEPAPDPQTSQTEELSLTLPPSPTLEEEPQGLPETPIVQLGVFSTYEAARIFQLSLAEQLDPSLERDRIRVALDDDQFLVHITGFEGADPALETCNSLRISGTECVVVQP